MGLPYLLKHQTDTRCNLKLHEELDRLWPAWRLFSSPRLRSQMITKLLFTPTLPRAQNLQSPLCLLSWLRWRQASSHRPLVSNLQARSSFASNRLCISDRGRFTSQSRCLFADATYGSCDAARSVEMDC